MPRRHPVPALTLGHLGPHGPPADTTAPPGSGKSQARPVHPADSSGSPPATPGQFRGIQRPRVFGHLCQELRATQGLLRPALASRDRLNPHSLGGKSKVEGVPGSGVIWLEAKISLDVRPDAPRR